MKQEDCCILLTATVTPNAYAGALTNPLVRRSHYVEALHYYLSHTSAKIVFVENSGSDIANDFNSPAFASRLEFLIYKDLPEAGNSNRGYKEMKMLEYAWAHSRLLPDCSVVLKITGRLKCINIATVIRYLPYLDSYMSVIVYPKHNYSDSRIFAMTYNVGHALFRYREEIGVTGIFENSLLHAVLTRPDDCSFRFFPVYPKMSGISGGDGRNYNDDLSFVRLLVKRAKYIGKRLYCTLIARP